MNKKTKIAAAALISFLAAGLIAGCGGDKKAASSAASAAADGKKHVKVVLSSTERPLSWTDENGRTQGYEYDILEAVNKNLKGYHLDLQAVPPETQDVMMDPEMPRSQPAVTTVHRAVKRITSYRRHDRRIFCRSIHEQGKCSEVPQLEDVIKGGGKLVPNTPNGGIYKVLTDWNKEHNNILKEVPIQDGLTPAERLSSLKSGQYDALVYPNNLGVEDIAKAMNLDLVALDKPIKVNETVLIVNKDEKELANEIEAALEKLSKDGTLKQISENGITETSSISWMKPTHRSKICLWAV